MKAGVLGMSAIVLLAWTACNPEGTLTGADQVIFPDSAVSYRNHVQPFMTFSCAFAGCHGDVNAAGGVRLTSYSNILFDRPNLIVPTKPDESLVIQVLDQRIPHSLDVLRGVTANHITGMRRWVREGAKNN